MALGTSSVFFWFFCIVYCKVAALLRYAGKNYRLTSQSRTQCAPKYTHIHSNTLRISFRKVNAMHFQVGDNDASPTEHQRHERERIHKNLPSSDSRDGPSRLDKTPRGGDSVEKKNKSGIFWTATNTQSTAHSKHWSKFAYNRSKNKKVEEVKKKSTIWQAFIWWWADEPSSGPRTLSSALPQKSGPEI